MPTFAVCWMVVLSALSLGSLNLHAGSTNPAFEGWSRTEDINPNVAIRSGHAPATHWAKFHLNPGAAQSILSRAPREEEPYRIRKGVEWFLPMPDGSFKRFLIVESPVMAPTLAARYPELKTYRGVGLSDHRDLLRLDLRHGKLHAQVLGPSGSTYIDPIDADASEYVTYDARYALRTADQSFECLTDTGTTSSAVVASGGGFQSDGMLRVFRLAVAATGEYTQFHGGTVEDGLGAIVTAVNRLNGIYESELSIRFMLVANNDRLVFVDPDTDPYSNMDAVAMLSQNQSTLDTLIGSDNYDVGQVFATGGGGLAQMNSVCVAGWKGMGVTGRASPTGDAFYVDYVAHEIGHQFGAHHTFNGVAGSCSANNRHAATAYEPGSGSTIMSYSDICGADNVQYGSDPYFHSASLMEIHDFLNSSCAIPEGTGNIPPVVDAGSDWTIPMGTPFELTAVGSDANDDVLTYCWEQLDLGAATALDGEDHGSGPLFRSFSPVDEPTRVFPRLDSLLRNVSSPVEVLPTTARTLNFRVTARDNRTEGGAFGMDTMQVTVTTNAGPFVVLFPNTTTQVTGEQTILWDVAGTDMAPVSAAYVDILLSTNGGRNFPVVLAEHTPNDGTEPITLPDIYAENARIKVKASDNIFFDISDMDFSVMPTSGWVVTETNSFEDPTSVLLPAAGTKGNASVFPMQIVVTNVEGGVENVTVQLHGLTHSFVDDLDILLVGPQGQKVMLLSDCSGGATADDVELGFSDQGEVFPNDGTLTSGNYQPANIGLTGDSFPVLAPYGSALSEFNEIDPNGVWSLYVVDDSTGDSGALARGWSLRIETRRLVEPTNQPPVIAAQPRRFVHAGTLLVVTNEAVDPDGDGGLIFALRPDSPAGAVLDSSGVLTWSPASSLVGTTNACVVSVTDSGTPAMTAESEFDIVVVGPPVIRSLQVTNGAALVQWSAVPNASYRLEVTEDLNAGSWIEAGSWVVSTGFTAGATCPLAGSSQKFFRLRVEP